MLASVGTKVDRLPRWNLLTSEGASTTRAVAQVYNTILATTRVLLSAFLEITKLRNAPLYTVVHSMPSEVLVTVSLWAGSPPWRQMIRVISKHRHSVYDSRELPKNQQILPYRVNNCFFVEALDSAKKSPSAMS